MFRSFSAYNFVFLFLVLGSCFNLASCDDDDESEEAVSKEDETVDEGKVDDSALDECKNPSESRREMCCSNELKTDKDLLKCIVLHRKNIPKDGETNPAALVKFLSCLIECVYKAKKYIGKGDALNMKAVKADANNLYKDSPREKEYMIEMFQYCEQDAAKEWGDSKKNPATKVLFARSCKPYYMFVFKCVINYSKANCPHFKLKDSKDTVKMCEEMKEKCEQLLG